MAFTAALHTYFAVSAIESVTVDGLSGVTYSDSLQGGVKVVQDGPVVFDQEVDRIYLAAPDAAMKVSSRKGGRGRTKSCWQHRTGRGGGDNTTVHIPGCLGVSAGTRTPYTGS